MGCGSWSDSSFRCYSSSRGREVDSDTGIVKGVLIPRLLNICFYTLLTEESWNFVKQFKNPTVNFKKLRNEVVNKIKKVKPDLFTKN